MDTTAGCPPQANQDHGQQPAPGGPSPAAAAGCHPQLVESRSASLPSSEQVARLAEFFRVISDPTRVRILWALDQGELCVGDLSALLGMEVSAISHQLRLLKANGLVRGRRQGKHVYYQPDDHHVRLLFETAVEHLGHQRSEVRG